MNICECGDCAKAWEKTKEIVLRLTSEGKACPAWTASIGILLCSISANFLAADDISEGMPEEVARRKTSHIMNAIAQTLDASEVCSTAELSALNKQIGDVVEARDATRN